MKKDLLKEFGKALLVSALMFAVKSLEDKGTANRVVLCQDLVQIKMRGSTS